MKKILITTVLLAVSSFAMASDIANWTDVFPMTGGHYAEHTPTHVSFDGIFQAGESLDFEAGSNINGATFGGCGLHLKTESTREEFVAALICSGMYQE